jgi:hypothetical protein
MLATTQGWAKFISTPNGFDHFYDFAERAKHNQDNWDFFSAPSTCNPLFTKEELELARADMSEAEFAQEIMAEFRDLTAGRAYVSFSDDNLHNSCPWGGGLFSPAHSLILAPDFNISPMSWNIGQNRDIDWWWGDEIVLKNSHTLEAAKELVSKVQLYRQQGWKGQPGREIIICGDATAKARQRAAGGKSDYDIIKQTLKDHNITWADHTPEINPSIKDRVNTVNSRCKDASGQIHMWVHPLNCPNLVKDLQRVVWKTGADATLDPGPKKELTHSSDGVGYAITEMTPIRSVKKATSVKVIQRTF